MYPDKSAQNRRVEGTSLEAQGTSSEWLPLRALSDHAGLPLATLQRWCKQKRFGQHQKQVHGNGGLHFEISIHAPAIPASAKARWRAEHGVPEVPATAPGSALTALLSGQDLAHYKELKGKTKKRIDRWLPILRAGDGLSGEALDRFCQLKQVNLKTYYSIKKEWHEHDCTLKGLIANWGQSKGATKVSDEQGAAFNMLFLTQARPSAKSVRRQLLGIAAQKPDFGAVDKFPSHMSFLRRLHRDMSREAIFRLRYGETAYQNASGYHIRRDYENILAGEVLVADHAQSDRAVLAPHGGVCFPWYTVFADVKTQKWLGWCLHLEGPNSDHIFLAFHDTNAKHGCGRDIILDNGKDFRVQDFAGGRKTYHMDPVDGDQTRMTALAIMDITAHFCKPYSPESKIIERTFGRFNSSYSRHHAGYRGPNVREKPEALASQIKNGEIITWEAFQAEFDEFVTKVFNREAVDGAVHQGKSPDELWEEEYPRAVEQKIVRHFSRASLGLFCARATEDREIKGNGFYFAPLKEWYYAEWMVPLVGTKAYLRIDIRHPDMAHVCESGTDKILGEAGIDRRAAALARTDEEQEWLRAKIQKQARINKIGRDLAKVEKVDTGDFLTNRIAAANAINEHRGVVLGKEMPTNPVLTDTDLQLAALEERSKIGTHKVPAELLPFRPIKKPKYDPIDLRSAAAGF